MRVSIIIGDIADAPAEALCTSTNPRLSLAMGTGASVLERGGWQVKRECESQLQSAGKDALPVGSVHATTAGALPAKVVFHCVASNAAHKSSAAVIAACVENALALASHGGCSSIAMPVFASGHAHFPFDRAVEAMATALAHATVVVDDVMIVVGDEASAASALRVLREVVPGLKPARR